jgi:hypothetical protein
MKGTACVATGACAGIIMCTSSSGRKSPREIVDSLEVLEHFEVTLSSAGEITADAAQTVGASVRAAVA